VAKYLSEQAVPHWTLKAITPTFSVRVPDDLGIVEALEVLPQGACRQPSSTSLRERYLTQPISGMNTMANRSILMKAHNSTPPVETGHHGHLEGRDGRVSPHPGDTRSDELHECDRPT
jgi:hypothetical protein